MSKTRSRRNPHDPHWWDGWKGRIVAYAIFGGLWFVASWLLDRADEKVTAAIQAGENPELAVGYMDAGLNVVAMKIKTAAAAVMTFIPVDLLLMNHLNAEDAFDEHYPDSVRVTVLVCWTAAFLGFLWFFGQG